MKTIRSNAQQSLQEIYLQGKSKWEETHGSDNPKAQYHSLNEWAELESESDPDFYTWLFGEWVGDFGSNLTTEERIYADEFIKQLKLTL